MVGNTRRSFLYSGLYKTGVVKMVNLLNDIENLVSKNWDEIEKEHDYLKIKKEREKQQEKYEMFFYMMDNLISLNKMNRNINCYKAFGLMSFLVKYCTVKIDIGRQSGKTEYIFKHAKENDLIILYNLQFKRSCLERYNNIKCDISTIRQINNNRENNRELKLYDTIWVDEYSFIKRKNDVDFIYNYFGKDINQTFVFMG